MGCDDGGFLASTDQDVGAFHSRGFQVGEEQEGEFDDASTASREDRELDGSGFQVSTADQDRVE